jgi:DNA-binding response OmpR family regulator
MGRILVVNDEPDLLAMCEMTLESEGHDVRTISDGVDIVETARSFRPDVIVLDWVIPGTSGEVLLDQLQATPDTRPIPVLVMTALDGIDMHARLLGARNVLRKPFRAHQLNAEVNRLAASSTE